MNKTVLILEIWNGLKYEDAEYKIIGVFKGSSTAKVLNYMDTHPITKELYKEIFGYDEPDYAIPHYMHVLSLYLE